MNTEAEIIYATKHSLSGVAASAQIKNQIRSFSNLYEDRFAVLYMRKEKEADLSDVIEKNFFSIDTLSTLIFFVKSIKFFWSSKKIRFIYTRDLLVAIAAICCLKKVVYECHHLASSKVQFFLKHFSSFIEIVTISQALKEFFVQSYKIPHKSISVFHDAVDFDLYSQHRESRDKYRSSLGFLESEVYAVYTGTIGPGRDLESFYSAILENEDIQFIVVGDDGSLFKKNLPITNFPNNLSFRGYLLQNEVLKYQIAADILINLLDECHPNYKYCSQLKLFEYLSTGNIVISCNIGSLSEVVNENNSIIYNKSNQPLSDMICKVSNSLDQFEHIKLNALNFAKKNTWKKRSEDIINKYI